MCGIAGIICADWQKIKPCLNSMLKAQFHRGPDDMGEDICQFGANYLGLGHRRLSILDLSPTGHQPMVHPATGDMIVFNGEIYNFHELRDELESQGSVFSGRSDTEVLLHAMVQWGTNGIKRLEGMFAFAFLSRRDNHLILARDPLGIKPLYMTYGDDSLLFASEVRALLTSGLVDRRLEPGGVAGYLAYGAVQSPCTLFRNIVSVPPGTFQIVTPDDIGRFPGKPPVEHWCFPALNPGVNKSTLTEEISQALDHSVKTHLISDVPLGIFLSSGLDSTAITGLAIKHSPDIRTFTVDFPEDSDMSEFSLADETARRLGTRHTKIPLSRKDLHTWVQAWFKDMDLPSIDGLNTYVISKAVKQEGITVALSGQGGDELFGGYPSFADVPKGVKIRKMLSLLPPLLRKSAVRTASLNKPEAVKMKMMDMLDCDGSLLSLYFHRRRTMSNAQMSLLGQTSPPGFNKEFIHEKETLNMKLAEEDPIACISMMESRFYLGNMLLRDGDEFSMAHSLEIRVPMLDRGMIDLLLSIPGHLRLPSGKADKHLLRASFKKYFAKEQLQQRKRGFILPIKRWMTGELKDYCLQGLDTLKNSGTLRPEGVDAVWGSFIKNPESPMWTRAWELCVLGIYLSMTPATP